MLHRYVRMSFKQESVVEFLETFKKVKPIIESFDGCISVILLKEKDNTKMMTYSIWENEKALDTYRNSDFFMHTWKHTKTLFNDKPKAFSMYKVE